MKRVTLLTVLLVVTIAVVPIHAENVKPVEVVNGPDNPVQVVTTEELDVNVVSEPLEPRDVTVVNEAVANVNLPPSPEPVCQEPDCPEPDAHKTAPVGVAVGDDVGAVGCNDGLELGDAVGLAVVGVYDGLCVVGTVVGWLVTGSLPS